MDRKRSQSNHKTKNTHGRNSTRKIHFKTKRKDNRREKNPNDMRTTYHKNNDKFRPTFNSRKFGAFEKAITEYKNVKFQKERAREDALRHKNEIQTALEKYKQRKKDRFKKLSAKTPKGQPIMRNRIEILLEKIQSMR